MTAGDGHQHQHSYLGPDLDLLLAVFRQVACLEKSNTKMASGFCIGGSFDRICYVFCGTLGEYKGLRRVKRNPVAYRAYPRSSPHELDLVRSGKRDKVLHFCLYVYCIIPRIPDLNHARYRLARL